MRPSRFAVIAAVLLIALMLAGCSRSNTPPTSTSTSNGGTTPMGAQQVSVDEGEWYLKLNPDTVKPGTVEFTIKNNGSFTHSFELKGQGTDQPLGKDLSPGQSATMTVNLPTAGSYEAFCPIDRHAERGMKATLTVAQ